MILKFAFLLFLAVMALSVAISHSHSPTEKYPCGRDEDSWALGTNDSVPETEVITDPYAE